MSIDADGRFTIGTADGRRLLYGHGSDPWSSLYTFRVDGVEYRQPYEGTDIVVETPPTLNGATIYCSFTLGNYRIWQYVTPIDFTATEGSVKIEYVIENNDAAAHDLDLLLELDTMVNNNDAAPLSTEFGYAAVETCFDDPGIPDYWQAFEVDPNQGPEYLVGQGTLNGYDATPPVRFAVGQWGDFYNAGFNYVCDDQSYGDSAVLLWWLNNIAPDNYAYMCTYYGIGEVTQSPGELSLTMSAPSELTCDQYGNLVPNPFSVNLIVTNTGDSVCEGVQATISMENGLTVVTDTYALGNIPAGDYATASFEVTATGDPCDQYIDYGCEVTSSTCESNWVDDTIWVPCCYVTEVEPSHFSLAQNYPNPFNPSTIIEYSLAEPVPVQIQITNLNGELISTLVNENGSVGTHTVEFNATGLPSGLYFYTLIAGDYITTRKMVLLQ